MTVKEWSEAWKAHPLGSVPLSDQGKRDLAELTSGVQAIFVAQKNTGTVKGTKSQDTTPAEQQNELPVK